MCEAERSGRNDRSREGERARQWMFEGKVVAMDNHDDDDDGDDDEVEEDGGRHDVMTWMESKHYEKDTF